MLDGQGHKSGQIQENSADNIEIWEDFVRIKDLVVALVICSITTLGAYFIAPNEPPKPLFFGLVGALVGFAISSFVIHPKRKLIVNDEKGEK
ncbi:hypothetical protein [Aquibacillus sediminis]|uniref:hypothetical protein n=1 Tax=Aquibacillus sediminis TaxID=2574734 RepID=UPI0011084B22|nr:hypothetical protein [Aquibacillus sediminis]